MAEIPSRVALLRRHSPLRRLDLIRISGGPPMNMDVEDDGTLRQCIFRLTDSLLNRLRIRGNAGSSGRSRTPLLSLDKLVLPEEARESLEIIAAQVRHEKTLFDEWGLGGTIPYGHGAAIFFHGPCGTGKTATAEALAHELNKRLLAVDYGRIVSCWVGETEKNISAAFRDAAEENAVLLFDEADSLVYDRTFAVRSWESREVNVFLTELERFHGLCILTTNRRADCDPALERRIALKIEFRRPDSGQARKIWERLIPPGLPLGKRIDLDRLASAGLSGGEIKNALLNAARRAILRGRNARVGMDDFLWAVEREHSSRRDRGAPVGFQPNHGEPKKRRNAP